MFRPSLTRTHSDYHKFKQNVDGNSNILGVKSAVIRLNLVLPISANIADVTFYHNTISVIGPHFKQIVTGILSIDSFNVH